MEYLLPTADNFWAVNKNSIFSARLRLRYFNMALTRPKIRREFVSAPDFSSKLYFNILLISVRRVWKSQMDLFLKLFQDDGVDVKSKRQQKI